jgi:hypothetical protein
MTRLVSAVLLAAIVSTHADNPDPSALSTAFLSASGVFPALTVTADSAPTTNVTSPRSECGVGALMAWADRLFVVSYLSVPYAGSGTGLYSIDQNMVMTVGRLSKPLGEVQSVSIIVWLYNRVAENRESLECLRQSHDSPGIQFYRHRSLRY